MPVKSPPGSQTHRFWPFQKKTISMTEPRMMSADQVPDLSYPDFVALMGQENTPPGGHKTLRAWFEKAGVGAESHLLDLACSTGFSSRNLAKISGCSGTGIDISSAAVEKALMKRKMSGLDRLDYRVADACQLPFPDQEFSHVLAGCNFAFIRDRQKALSECRRVLKENGRLCVANFYYKTRPDTAMLDDVEKVIGFRPEPAWTSNYWWKFFREQFTLAWEKDCDLPVEPEAKVVAWVERQIRVVCREALAPFPFPVVAACYDRLLNTRLVLNRHRQFQASSIQIWK